MFDRLLSEQISTLHIAPVTDIAFGPHGIALLESAGSKFLLHKRLLRCQNIFLPIQRHLTAFLCVSSFSAFKLNFRCRNQDFVITSAALDYLTLFFDKRLLDNLC